MKLLLILMMIAAAACSCNPIEYVSDNAFINSAQANSTEFMVRINNKVCKDLDGKVGLCAKRTASNKSIILTHDPRPYSYRIVLKCSKATGIDVTYDVKANAKWSYTIDPESFYGIKSFTCLGEIFPHDRDKSAYSLISNITSSDTGLTISMNPVSALWHIRFIVFDEKYQERESIYKFKKDKKEYFVLGQHSRYVTYKGKNHNKKTAIKISGSNQVYTESEKMRFNYFNY